MREPAAEGGGMKRHLVSQQSSARAALLCSGDVHCCASQTVRELRLFRQARLQRPVEVGGEDESGGAPPTGPDSGRS